MQPVIAPEALAPLYRLAEENLTAMELFSYLLNEKAAFISKADVESLARDCGILTDEAFAFLVAAACGLESDRNPGHRRLERRYLRPALRQLDSAEYKRDPYYSGVRFPEKALGRWQLTHLRYAPYQVFPCGHPLTLPDGREIPPLGYFTEEFSYPAVRENGRDWMTVSPNEIATMEADIEAAHGKTAVFGLGLGYYAFMIARKPEVTAVDLIEREPDAIALFQAHLLPQFPHREKIRIIPADAFDYLQGPMAGENYDFAFVDLWHDVSDGLPLYWRCRRLEKGLPGVEFRYWIEPSLLIFLRGLILDSLQSGEGTLDEIFRARAAKTGAWQALLTESGLRALMPLLPEAPH